jgi:hypothetical protein
MPMRLIRIALVSALVLGGCGTGSLILWNPRTGLFDEVPTAAAYALGGALFAAPQDVDKWALRGAQGRRHGADAEADHHEVVGSARRLKDRADDAPVRGGDRSDASSGR